MIKVRLKHIYGHKLVTPTDPVPATLGVRTDRHLPGVFFVKGKDMFSLVGVCKESGKKLVGSDFYSTDQNYACLPEQVEVVEDNAVEDLSEGFIEIYVSPYTFRVLTEDVLATSTPVSRRVATFKDYLARTLRIGNVVFVEKPKDVVDNG